MDNLKELLGVAESTARTAGEILKNGADRRVALNTQSDVKLQADLDSERLIRERLSQTGLPIIGEELGGDPALFSPESKQSYWVVDPLDGTFNYQRNQALTCVSIGLMCGNEPLLGVIYNFNVDECISGLVGEGLFINGKRHNPQWAEEIAQACLMTGFPALADKSPTAMLPFFEQISRFKKIRMIGSAALAISYVATGKADVYQENNTNLWDIAAGIALIKSAGGFYKMEKTGKHPLNLNLRCVGREAWL